MSVSAAAVEDIINRKARALDRPLEILEAGCGRFRHFAYPEPAEITGLDICPDQLARNTWAKHLIHADVETYQTQAQWDVVVSIFVLEHLHDPERALANMLQWTRPDGLLILAVPNVLSLKGLVTKLTPFRFHDWFYRHVYRRPYSIFPTTIKFCIRPRALRRALDGHEIVLEEYSQETLGRPFHSLYAAMILLLRAATLGRWRAQDSNYLLIIRRNL